MNDAIVLIGFSLFVIGLLVSGAGATILTLRHTRQRITGHWVEHKHNYLGHWVPWIQPVSTGTTAQNIVEICEAHGFECQPGERIEFNVPARTARHRDSHALLSPLLGTVKRARTATRRRRTLPGVRTRKVVR